MSVKKSEIAYISSLSKLKMEDAEMDNYTRQISEILEMIQQLEKVDTHDIEPMAHPLNMKQRLRLDLVTEENRRELYQKNAVVFEEGFYKVPKVIE
ncbi:MAG: Asp-tRNA(Asn)/Glu-tRNA(Gln) amidotransferase subunit GatC [Gammaproteobacteria bacterium]|jgi:aspartyl-tRNA(Asn)/glutamyl-tRNA(Gln) amidotransferase subunit C|nr:Asp-tRNA(Asn)/Glu-tRNA(Gln) amidotransferase subunit GatC [Gammaproteobacteria bacterium]HIA92623.1 Asp-tRNA(Asn)/Glu-tRNA(Gln) amidotransferase subunit GatC [Gammaproteobacteria bacterium]HIB25090.1 Asp-tRNA(Asn)/Glu-tRNA(Gln) amidotransferase subunit GatC [Gammaproteobacteria bacterium]